MPNNPKMDLDLGDALIDKNVEVRNQRKMKVGVSTIEVHPNPKLRWIRAEDE